MEPVGIAIGVIGLSTVLVATVKKLRKTVQSIKYAQRDLQDVDEIINLFAGTYNDFLDVCEEPSSSTEGALKARLLLISLTERTINGFQNILDKVQAVARDPKYHYSVTEIITAHYNWIISKNTIKYLRASLSVARQSMIAFTNTRIIERLNAELAYLKSALPPTERQRVELRNGMKLEARIELKQEKLRNRRVLRRKMKKDLEEALGEVKVHEKNIKDKDFVPQTKSLLRFQSSVNRYVDQVSFQERFDRRARHLHRGSSTLTSQSTATTPTQSTQSSNHRPLAPESPPTSPEPTHEDLPDEIRSEGEESTCILKFCRICAGTCTNTEAHNTSIQHAPPVAASQTSLDVPPVVPQPLPKPASTAKRGRTSSCTQTRRTRLSSQKPMLPSNAGHEVKIPYQAKQSIDPVIHEGGDAGASQDETSEEEDPSNEQAPETGPSIWQATGGFEGQMPKGLRLRRQRSQSPQDFW